MDKIIYVGAGVSTQYGVLHLLKNGYDPKKIIIIEKGDNIYNRKSSDIMVQEDVVPLVTSRFYNHGLKVVYLLLNMSLKK